MRPSSNGTPSRSPGRCSSGGEGGPILVAGSARLARTLLAHGLVDELRLMLFPVLVGGGSRLFPEDQKKITFDLVDLVRYPGGVQLQVYRPAPAEPAH